MGDFAEVIVLTADIHSAVVSGFSDRIPDEDGHDDDGDANDDSPIAMFDQSPCNNTREQSGTRLLLVEVLRVPAER